MEKTQLDALQRIVAAYEMESTRCTDTFVQQVEKMNVTLVLQAENEKTFQQMMQNNTRLLQTTVDAMQSKQNAE
jgi:uncharacterized membrane protein